MFRSELLALILLAGVAPGGDYCRISTGPDGLCAALRLDPSRVDLRVGSTLRIRVNGIDCTPHPGRLRWRSTAPDVAAVDSTGLITAESSGSAVIRLEGDGLVPDSTASVRVVVVP